MPCCGQGRAAAATSGTLAKPERPRPPQSLVLYEIYRANRDDGPGAAQRRDLSLWASGRQGGNRSARRGMNGRLAESAAGTVDGSC